MTKEQQQTTLKGILSMLDRALEDTSIPNTPHWRVSIARNQLENFLQTEGYTK